ncbi:hypothetical protein Tco_1443492, partial [Tanacetum coccineum]
QKVDDAQEIENMKEHIKVVPDEEEVAIDVIPLATKPPSIVDWKIYKEGQISYYQITKADGSSNIRCNVEESIWKQSVDLEAFLFLWSTLCKVSKSAHLYAGREKHPPGDHEAFNEELEILKKNVKFKGGLLGLKDFLKILELLLLRSDEYAYSVLVMVPWDRMGTPTQCDMFVWYILSEHLEESEVRKIG